MGTYRLEIGLIGETVEHTTTVEAADYQTAQAMADNWALETYCIAQVTAVDDKAKLADQLKLLKANIACVAEALASANGDLKTSEVFISTMQLKITEAIDYANRQTLLSTPGPENQGEGSATQN